MLPPLRANSRLLRRNKIASLDHPVGAILELGGNNGAIVAPSADLDLAVRAIAFAAMGTAGNKIGRQRRQAIVSTLCPQILNCHIATFDVAGFRKPAPECVIHIEKSAARTRIENSDHRHLLLRARGDRPCNRSTAEQPNELAPPHGLRPQAEEPHPSI
jgi:hypothetical protein